MMTRQVITLAALAFRITTLRNGTSKSLRIASGETCCTLIRLSLFGGGGVTDLRRCSLSAAWRRWGDSEPGWSVGGVGLSAGT